MSSPASELLEQTKIVRAGAGAGKTRNLSLQVLDWVQAFYQRHARWPHLVVSTFTVKATQELRERMLTFAEQRQNPLLLEYVRSASYLQISTIHGVLTNLLRKYGHGIGLDSSFEILGQAEHRRIWVALLRQHLNREVRWQELLTEYSFSELISFMEKLYAAYLLGENPQAMGLLPMEDFYQQRLQKFAARARVCALQILDSLGDTAKPTKTEQNWRLWAQLFVNFRVDSLALLPEACAPLLTSISRMPSNPGGKLAITEILRLEANEIWQDFKDIAAWPTEILPELPRIAHLNQLLVECSESFLPSLVEERIQQAKISMADIELLAAYLLRQRPDFAAAFSESIDYWLIDEFQDTSPLQFSLLQKMIGDSPYYLVGDPQQSIYFFRGADQTLFLQQEKHILAQGGEHQLLMKNYRSEPACMSFINDFMGSLGFARMETRDPVSTEDSASLAAEIYLAESTENEIFTITQRILLLLASGVSPSEICVLARKRDSLSQLARQLQVYRVPHYLHVAGSFYERREILDVLALLKFLVHAHDKQNLIELLRSPWFYVEDIQLYHWQQQAQLDWSSLRAEDHPSLRKLQSLRDFAQDYGLTAALEHFVHHSGILETCRHYDASGKREANLWKFLCDLREQEKKNFFNPLEVVRKAEELQKQSKEGEVEAVAALEPNRVQLMTIHASKGLEFPHVFICQMHKSPQLSNKLPIYLHEGQVCLPVAMGQERQKRLPDFARAVLQELQEREREESLRVLYVAMTRAEQKLYLSWVDAIEPGSWLDGLAWDLSEGVHETETYRYQVARQCSEQIPYESEWQNVSLRAPWQGQMSDYFRPLETDSVSRWLEQRTEYGRQQRKGENQDFQGAVDFQKKLTRSSEGSRLHQRMEAYIAALQTGREHEFLARLSDLDRQWLEKLMAIDTVPWPDLLPQARLEWGFLLSLPNNRILEGQIDFWSFDSRAELWVVDYKTGSSRYAANAMEQLKLYALALAQQYPQTPIHMVAAYVGEGKCIHELFQVDKMLESL